MPATPIANPAIASKSAPECATARPQRRPLLPGDGELVIEKAYPNGFRETTLEQVLRTSADDEVVIAGMMSSMCVDATARAAVDLGFEVTIVHDACAAPSLEFADVEVPGEQVHAAFMAALADYGAIVGARELTNRR